MFSPPALGTTEEKVEVCSNQPIGQRLGAISWPELGQWEPRMNKEERQVKSPRRSGHRREK